MKKKYLPLKIIIFIVGLGIFAYPIVSNLYSDITQTKAIDKYKEEIGMRTSEEIEQSRQNMVEYNKVLETGIGEMGDPFGEEETGTKGADLVLDSLGEEYGKPIGVLSIPAIDLDVPIFTGTSEMQLQRGVGVMPGTSMPIGEAGTHSVITGHRGLPTAKLFSDLPQVKDGDLFYVNILNEMHAYKVVAIKTIEPNDISDLKIVPGQDIITLLTCTPYMVNTHRLIVTGTRVPYAEEKVEEPVVQEATATQNCCCYLWIILAIGALGLLNFIMLILVYRRLGKKQGETKPADRVESASTESIEKEDKIE